MGYSWAAAFGENLELGAGNAASAVAGWMRSAPHRTNLLGPAYTELGTGAARDAAGRAYHVQLFARPAP